jgi:hypothetical protein
MKAIILGLVGSALVVMAVAYFLNIWFGSGSM